MTSVTIKRNQNNAEDDTSLFNDIVKFLGDIIGCGCKWLRPLTYRWRIATNLRIWRFVIIVSAIELVDTIVLSSYLRVLKDSDTTDLIIRWRFFKFVLKNAYAVSTLETELGNRAKIEYKEGAE